MCNTPGRRWEKPLDDLMVMSGLWAWDSGGRPAMYYHTCRPQYLDEEFKYIENSFNPFNNLFILHTTQEVKHIKYIQANTNRYKWTLKIQSEKN